MKRYVLDSYALIAYFEGEEGGKSVADILKKALDNTAEVYLCRVNWGEMYYIAMREQGVEKAESFRKTLDEYPVQIVDVGEELTLDAARIKASRKMSFADAFAAALAKEKKAELVTGDKEFKSVEGTTKIHWI